MVTFSFMNKAEKAFWLPRMFDLFYDNMSLVTPSGLPYDREREQFLANVSPALEKKPRQVLLALEKGNLVGYIQYYTRGELLMVEEMQLRREYHRTMLFGRMCRYLISGLDPEIRYIEAYADPRNRNSLGIMEKLGMAPVLEEASGFVHLRGTADAARKRFGC